jgi:hypothetical protein
VKDIRDLLPDSDYDPEEEISEERSVEDEQWLFDQYEKDEKEWWEIEEESFVDDRAEKVHQRVCDAVNDVLEDSGENQSMDEHDGWDDSSCWNRVHFTNDRLPEVCESEQEDFFDS